MPEQTYTALVTPRLFPADGADVVAAIDAVRELVELVGVATGLDELVGVMIGRHPIEVAAAARSLVDHHDEEARP